MSGGIEYLVYFMRQFDLAIGSIEDSSYITLAADLAL